MGKRRGRGEGSIERTPDGRFIGVLSLGKNPATGKRRKRKFYGRTKGEALAKLRDAQHRQASGTLDDAGRLDLAGWLDRWLGIKRESVEPTTYEQYATQVRCHLKPHGGALKLAGLRPLQVADLLARLAAAGVSGAMRAKLATTLRTALDDAVKAGLIPANPAKAVAKPKGRRPDTFPLDADQVLTFLDACTCHPMEALFRVALDTGMRQGELFGLLGDCVDPDAGAVTVRRSLARLSGRGHGLKDTKSAGSRRTLRLSPGVAGVLRAYLAGRRVHPDRPVFTDSRGGFLWPTNFHRRTWRPFLDHAGLPPVRFHDLRHTCATLLLLRGCNIKAVSRRLGHSNVVITLKTYTHLLPEMDDQILDALGSIYGGSRSSPNSPPALLDAGQPEP